MITNFNFTYLSGCLQILPLTASSDVYKLHFSYLPRCLQSPTCPQIYKFCLTCLSTCWKIPLSAWPDDNKLRLYLFVQLFTNFAFICPSRCLQSSHLPICPGVYKLQLDLLVQIFIIFAITCFSRILQTLPTCLNVYKLCLNLLVQLLTIFALTCLSRCLQSLPLPDRPDVYNLCLYLPVKMFTNFALPVLPALPSYFEAYKHNSFCMPACPYAPKTSPLPLCPDFNKFVLTYLLRCQNHCLNLLV